MGLRTKLVDRERPETKRRKDSAREIFVLPSGNRVVFVALLAFCATLAFSPITQATEIQAISNQNPHVRAPEIWGEFDHIYEFDPSEKLGADGTNTIWIYYQSGENIVKLVTSSLSICIVSPASKTDLEIITFNWRNEIPKSSAKWDLAQEMWKAALRRLITARNPKAIC